MELKEFVSETLKQILAGVRTAQDSEDGGMINAESVSMPGDKNIFSAGTYGNFMIVEFDVAVSAERGGKGGANLTVFGVGVEGRGDFKAGIANRIQFAVPVRIPDGQKKRLGVLEVE